MNDRPDLPGLEAIKARLLNEVAAEFDRDMAEAARLAAKYPNLVLLAAREHAAKVVGPSGADGTTLGNLVDRYLTDGRSPYSKTQFQTRRNYDAMLRRLVEECGNKKLAELKAPEIRRLYETWSAGGEKMAMAHSLATMLRGIVNFGNEVLQDSECERLSVVLHNLRFKVSKSQLMPVTAGHAKAIIIKANAIGMRSIALAQAFQFECKLGQKDVIGEWVPRDEPGISDVIHGNNKWRQGIRYSEIDENLILRHTTSRAQEAVEIDLKLAPMVTEELKRRGALPVSGPVIVYERTGRPYEGFQFRHEWRRVADAAGISKSIKNMSSRSADDGVQTVQKESAR
jgi:hypothetical protein